MRHGVLFRSTATLAIAAFVAGCATTQVAYISQDSVEQDVDVKLTMKGNKCGVLKTDIVPDPVRPKRSRRDKVKWHIHNACTMELAEVKIVLVKDDPFDPCPKVIQNLKPGHVKPITCQVRSNAIEKPYLYPYTIYINGDPAVDPDIEVWP